ncbi:hypothetical protein IWW38_002213, partial [Coemansia aciculifera]
MFTDKHLEIFQRDGCVVVPDFLLPKQVSALRQRTHELLLSFDPSNHPLTTFSTGQRDQHQPGMHIGDQYYFDSADKASFFLDEGALDGHKGRLTVDPHCAINKIGHGLHLVESLYADITHSDKVKEIANKLGYQDPRVLGSMVVCKQPIIGGAIPWHQDSTFIFTQPLSACGFWIALEDSTLENGCLEYIPGSHLTTSVARRFIRKTDNSGTDLVKLTRNGNIGESISEPLSYDGGTFLQVAAGSLVLINGQVLHRSSHNHSNKSRWAYTFHIVEGTAEYDKLNWQQMPDDAGLPKLYL